MLHITYLHILDEFSVSSDQFPWFLGNRKFLFRDFCSFSQTKSFLRSVFRFFSQKPGIYPYVKFHGGFENDNHFCPTLAVFEIINPKVVKNSKNQWFSWIHATYRCSFSKLRFFPYERPVDSETSKFAPYDEIRYYSFPLSFFFYKKKNLVRMFEITL